MEKHSIRQYEDCYVAFMDLLGFKNRVKNSSCEEVAEIFDEIKNIFNKMVADENGNRSYDADELKIKIMSDSICVYLSTDIGNSLTIIIQVCAIFQAKMLSLNEPVLVRGGITRGSIYSSEDVIFGNGLTNAYLLESNNAKYPRIVIAKDTLNKYEKEYDLSHPYKPTISDLYKYYLRIEDDMLYSLNYISIFESCFNDKKSKEKLLEQIQSVLDTTTDNKIREKNLYVYKQLQIQ